MRVTVFGAEGTARTFDHLPGDVGIVPRNMGHFVQNAGDVELEILEIFRADEFRDISLFQWLGETPMRMMLDTCLPGTGRPARGSGGRSRMRKRTR